MKSKRYLTQRALPRRNALVVALALGMGISGLAYGQATTGAIFGSAPVGDTVQVVSNSGLSHTVTVGSNGQYSFSHLPLGVYTVTLKKDGQVVSSRNDVQIQIGGASNVSFASASSENAQNLGAVQVTANALPTIDVTTTHNSTIITAQQLQKLPLGHNGTAIALLTPGTMSSSAFGGGINFGGSSISENAYYVNGYNTGDPYRNEFFFELPYGAIAQQSTMAGGFGAKFGRSDGGVISQTGKRGTNEWHFGAQIRWAPRSLSAAPRSIYRPYQSISDQTFPCADPTTAECIANGGVEKFTHAPNYKPGTLSADNSQDGSWGTTYTGYIGGPLIKDKLFFFADVAYSESSGSSYGSVDDPSKSFSSSHSVSYYGKIDWNINDNNILEFTYLGANAKSGQGITYHADAPTGATTTPYFVHDQSPTSHKYYIAKYTSYISDNATFSMEFGKGRYENPIIYGNDTNLPRLYSVCGQNPAYWAPGSDPNDCANAIRNTQTNRTVVSPDRASSSHGLRADFSYQLGDHKLGVGIDNMYYHGTAQGSFGTGGAPPAVVGPFPGGTPTGTAWIYGYASAVGGYYARYYYTSDAAGMATTQKAYYFQDNWQVTPNLALVLGLRNDEYINYNNVGLSFVDQKNQWSPRIGASWDVFGDSSLKIWGNVGRYYLALPLNAANRAANSSFFLSQYFNYTGIDPDTGIPQGLTPVANPRYGTLTSPDGETGGIKDPEQVTAANLKSMYTDQINLGFDAALGDNWAYGASAHYRSLGTTIDDECAPYLVAAKMVKMGLDPNDYSDSLYGPAYCRLVNPGRTSDLILKKNGSQYNTVVPMTFEDWGYPDKPERVYASLDLYLEHPFDGKWYGRIDYTYAYAHGNTTGQVRPDFAQQDVSKTEDWDDPSLMSGATGELLSSRKHMLRVYGFYQVTPEWLVSANFTMKSGLPRECLGYYGADALHDPSGYNNGGSGNYHWCLGHQVHPGSDGPLAGHTPWLHNLDMSVTYSPAFADHKLDFKLIVYNVTNSQGAEISQANHAYGPHIKDNFFHFPKSYQAPRSVDLVINYNY